MTAPAIDEIILPHLYFTQFFGDRFAVVIGKLDTTGGDANEFAHGRGDDKFMNLAFSFNPVVITLAPYAPLGMSLLFFPHKDVIYSFAVVDTQGPPNTTGFSTLFQDPTTLTNEVRVTVRPFGLTGHQLLGTAWANKPFTLLPQDRRTIIRNILLGTPLETTSNNWAVYYNFDQYLYQDEHNPTRGFGIFFRAGVSNPRTSAFQQFYSFGFGGKGIIPGRENDRFGIGYYYLKFSNDIPSGLRRLVSLDHEQGAELFYNFEIFPWLHVTPDLQIISPSRKTPGYASRSRAKYSNRRHRGPPRQDRFLAVECSKTPYSPAAQCRNQQMRNFELRNQAFPDRGEYSFEAIFSCVGSS
jgi:porin